MFYGKRIQQFEEQQARMIAQMKKLQDEVDYLKEAVNLLALGNTVMQFDVEEHVAALKEIGASQDKIDLIFKMRDDYEKKLRRYIRSVTSKKKIKRDGKEAPATAE